MAAKILHIVAQCSNSGKTTVIEKLLPELIGYGLRVAALKGEVHHYDLDIPGKDTWRFSEAGAAVAGMTTPDKYILIGRAPQGGTAAAMEMLSAMDLVLVEGDRQSAHPKIEVVRSAVCSAPTITNNLIALVTDIQDLQTTVPRFGLEDSKGLAAFIYRQYLEQQKPGVPGALTHFDPAGRPQMVDVTEKQFTAREAYARGQVEMSRHTLELLRQGGLAKGDVLSVAQVAAVMAVKETGRLIPMAHPLPVSGVAVDFNLVVPPGEKCGIVEIGVRVRTTAQTGVEMEALTGVSAAALTIYDMCKAVDKEMVIGNIRLIEKKGGRSGHYRREQK